MNNGLLIGNRGGISTVLASLSSAGSSSTNAVYLLPNHTFRNGGPAGLIVATFDTASTSVLGVTLTVNNQTKDLTDSEGNAVTDLTAGDHIITFNRVADTLKLIS